MCVVSMVVGDGGGILLQSFINWFQLQMCVCGLQFSSYLLLFFLPCPRLNSVLHFLSPPQFCHIYAFGLDALFALVLTQDKNCCLFSALCFCVPQLLSNPLCSSPKFVCLHICLNICRVKAVLLSLVRLFFQPLISNKCFCFFVFFQHCTNWRVENVQLSCCRRKSMSPHLSGCTIIT